MNSLGTRKRVQKGTLALIATTRSRAPKEAEEETHRLKKQRVSGVCPNSQEQKENVVWDMGTKLDDSVFHGGREKVYASRRQKREERRKYTAQVCPDSVQCSSHRLQKVSSEDLKTWQEADPSLKAIKEGAKHGRSVNGVSCVRKEGILHRVVEPVSGEGDVIAREQLVLPVQCRRMVIPIAGHLQDCRPFAREILLANSEEECGRLL